MPRMKNTAQLQMEFWKDDSGTRTRVLTFQIVDTPPANAWLGLLEEQLNHSSYTGPKFRITSTNHSNIDTASKELFNIVNHINENYAHLGFSLPEWEHPRTGTIEEQIFKLNRLHEAFHEEEGDNSIFGATLETREKRLIFKRLIHDVNVKVHQLEENFRAGTGPKSNSFAVTYLNGINAKDKKSIKIEDYWRAFFTDDPHEQGCYLTTSYCTIGKDLYTCQGSNDVDLVKKGMVAPKIDITTEFVINKTERDASTHKTFNFWHQMQRTHEVIKWVIDNDLMDYIDITDRKHFYPSTCVLGYADENISTQEFDTLLSEWKLHRLILDRTKTDA